MHGVHAFCPSSGSTLSEETIVDETGQEQRYPVADQQYGEDSWALTTGATCSSKIALMSRFRECHERHHDPDDDLYCRVAVFLRKLKAETDGESATRDEWIWFALAERLDRAGEPTEWMHAHADQVCPNCGGPLQWLKAPRGTLPKCVNDCYGDNQFIQHKITERIATVYNRAFTDDVKPAELEVVP